MEKTEVTGRVYSCSNSGNQLYLTIERDSAPQERTEVIFPVRTRGLAVIQIASLLTEERIKYTRKVMSNEDLGERHPSSWGEYSIEFLEGKLKGQVFEDTDII